MQNTGYYFSSPEDGELLSARFRGVIALCENRKVLLVSGDDTDEVNSEWFVSSHECIFNLTKSGDLTQARTLSFQLWEKTEALRALQKEAACSSRWDVADYISSVLHTSLLCRR